MKKFLAFTLCMLMVIPALLVGCTDPVVDDNTATTVKFGAGYYASAPAVADATEDKNGSGKLDVTFAALTVDADGKIAACELDTASNTVEFTNDGKAVANAEFLTKYQLGADYNMVAYGGSAK